MNYHEKGSGHFGGKLLISSLFYPLAKDIFLKFNKFLRNVGSYYLK